MRLLYLTVEGQTEAAFVHDVLREHLATFGVMVPAPRFTGPHGRRGGRIPRGGMFNTFRHVLEDMRRWMKENASPDARFSMMVDLYGLPPDCPGTAEAMTRPNGHDQAAIMEAALALHLDDRRFIPYLQVHEFEALVLAEPPRFTELFEHDLKGVESLIEECSPFKSPEEINHGQNSHPKARIQNCLPDYDSNIHGPLLAFDIGLQTIRDRCPHFNAWLMQLEQLDSGTSAAASD
jgi:hypothetical protein